MQQFVISAIGPDQPGIVNKLTKAVEQLGGNLADSRMINLKGQFAVVMLVEIAPDQHDPLKQSLTQVAQPLGLVLSFSTDPSSPSVQGIPYRIRTYAMDQVGLVHRITHQLHSLNVNIEELNTQLEHGAHSGTPLFTMDMIVTIPKDVALVDVRRALEDLCAQLNCDLDIDRA